MLLIREKSGLPDICYYKLMNQPLVFFVTGISGSGKTSVARELIKRGYTALDSKVTKGIFHFADKNGTPAQDFRPNDQDWSTSYKWVLNVPMLEQAIRDNAGKQYIFVCGRGNIRQHWDLAHAVFLLQVDETTMLSRLNDPSRDNMFAKDKKTQQKLRENLEFVQRSLKNAGAIVIDAKQPLEKVVDDIVALALMSVREKPDRTATLK